jgi:hypothetical protein
MASITQRFLQFTLTASTPGNATAPITYTLVTPLNGTITFGTAAIGTYTVQSSTDGAFRVFLADGTGPINLPSGTSAPDFINLLTTAATFQEKELLKLATTIPGPSPGAEPTSEPQKTPAATPDTTGPSESFSEAFADLIDEPPTTTNPSNSLPLGDDINDIYDPNLTPEQIASLDPRDQELRRQFFSGEDDEDPGVDSTGGEIIVEGARRQSDAFRARKDWRVRLALSDDQSVNYLYKAPNPGILKPLNKTSGVIFPYTPNITVNYVASYNPTELVHSNYKAYQYSSSSVDSVTITCDFTAQDTYEANYLLAVIHFFRSATKMFYGQDENPRRGTPPPLCYIYGMGSYQFAGQPLAIANFSYNLPTNVDYIKTSPDLGCDEPSLENQKRLSNTNVEPGGKIPRANFTLVSPQDNVSWVPSKIQLTISCVPMPSRNQVSNNFSFEKYATGCLLNGVGTTRGAFW